MIVNSIHHLLRGRSLVAVAPDDTVRAACARLEAGNVDALAVIEDGRLVGIMSERDVVRRCIAANRPSAETRVQDVMTPDPVTVPLKAGLASAHTLMVASGVRHLPVLDSAGECIGMISMRDIPTGYRLMTERAGGHRTPAPM